MVERGESTSGASAATALVFAGGDPVPAHRAPDMPGAGMVIAADSGTEHALALGYAVDLVVGDLDSVAPDALARATDGGATVEQHPAVKDQTDLELALRAAVAHGATRVIVVGGAGGRLDHLLANALVLASPRFAHVAVEWFTGARARAAVARPDVAVRVAGEPGDACSLLALGGPVDGVRTDGLVYPLGGETLHPGSTRGISNQLMTTEATVTIGHGALLVVQPDPDGA